MTEEEIEETIDLELDRLAKRVEQKNRDAFAKYGDRIREACPGFIERSGKMRFGASALLNHPTYHSTAAAAGKITVSLNGTGAIGSLQFTDCGEMITLDLNFRDEDSRENVLYKLRQIERVASKLRQAIEKATGVTEIFEEARGENND